MERRPGKKKLSKNLLEMKFMKRTKEKTEKIEEEEVRSRMFDGEVSGAMRDGASRIVVEPSYVNIENLRFGRLAFKGWFVKSWHLHIFYIWIGFHLIVKLREREGQRVDLGRSLKGHLWMVDGGIPFPDALH